MSVRVMASVFEHSQSKGTDRLVLLAIADSANDQGCEAWPSMSTIARKAGVDRRTVARSISRLCELGELERVRKGGLSQRGGTSNSYRVVVSSPQKEGQSAPSDTAPLGAERPSSRGSLSPKWGQSAPLSIHNRPEPSSSAAEPVDKFDALVAEVMKRKLKNRKAQTHLDPVGNDKRWIEVVRPDVLAESGDELRSLVDAFPSEHPRNLAEVFEGKRPRSSLRQEAS